MANGDAPVANRAEFLKKIHNLEVVAGYLHVFLLAPLMVYNATTRGAGYYAQWCYTLGIGSQGSLIPLWVA